VYALVNQFVIDFFQPCHGDFLSFVQAADLVILTVTTVQITTGEEHGSGAFCAAEAGLFPHMDARAGNDRQNAYAAAAKHAVGIVNAVGAVDAAAVGANIT
jgi:hypothetical protein